MTSEPMNRDELARILNEPTVPLRNVPTDPQAARARASAAYDENVRRTLVSATEVRKLLAEHGPGRTAAMVGVTLATQFDRVQLANSAAVALVLLAANMTDADRRGQLADAAYQRAVALCGRAVADPAGNAEPCPPCLIAYTMAELMDAGIMLGEVQGDDGLMDALAAAGPPPPDPTA